MENEDWKILGVILGVVFFVIVGAISFSKSQMQKSCANFGSISNRETKYVEYTYFKYDCITKTKDNKWISTQLLRDTE